MKESKLIRLLRSLGNSEYKQLGEFLHSPFVEKNRHTTSLHKYLQRHHPNFSSKSLNYETIFKKIFPGEEFDYARLVNVISVFYRSSEKFIAHLRLERQQDKLNLNLLNELLDRKLPGDFEKKFKKIKNEYIDNNPFDESDHKLLLDKLYDGYVSQVEPNSGFKSLQERFDSYLEHALNNIVKFYNQMYHENREHSIDYDRKFMGEVIRFLGKSEIESDALKINYKILMLEKNKKEEDFNELRALVPSKKDNFTFETLERIYLHLHGYCVWQTHANVSWEYYRESFVLIKEMVELEIVNTGNTDYMDFLNVVKMGASHKEYEWVDEFIGKFSASLPEDLKEDIINFAYGNVEYTKRNYIKALDYFARCNFKSFMMKVQVKILIVKMHYEAGNYEQMLSATDSFRHYLKREKELTEEYKKSFKAFLAYTEELGKLKFEYNESGRGFEIESVSKKIETMNYNALGVKVWLQNKYKELKKAKALP